MTDVTLNIDGLEKLTAALKAGRLPLIKIGILGTSPRGGGGGPTNAQIGAWHEFGTSRTPVRSFLRVPLADHLGPRLKAAGALDPEVLAEVLEKGTLRPWAEMVAGLAEGIVADAFDTGGFGKWPALSPYTVANRYRRDFLRRPKGTLTPRSPSNQVLVDTQQLRNSISSVVTE